MVEVSWNDAVAFCDWLSRKEGKSYRLPTEAEWEYACRAGTKTRYYNGDNPEKLVDVGNVADGTIKENKDWRLHDGVIAKMAISAKDGYLLMAPVGRFKPNAWGLYDMHGNAQQHCADWYNYQYYKASPTDNPKGPSDDAMGPSRRKYRVARGSCFDSLPADARSAARGSGGPDSASYTTGLRVAMTP